MLVRTCAPGRIGQLIAILPKPGIVMAGSDTVQVLVSDDTQRFIWVLIT